MDFDLSAEVIDQIIFGMENQDNNYILDTMELKVRESAELGDDLVDGDPFGRFIDIPPWKPVHGYHLMEGFVGTLHNPLYRERLRNILNSGQGVFRQFKNTVKEKKEIEHLWFHYKRKEMRRLVYEWYNVLRESRGLEQLPFPSDDFEELVLSDFTIEKAPISEYPKYEELDKQGFFEMFPEENTALIEYLYKRQRNALLPFSSIASLVYKGLSPDQEFSGFIWGMEESFEGKFAVTEILQVYVLPEFRGIGLGKTLLNHFCSDSFSRGADIVLIDLPGKAAGMKSSLDLCGFELYSGGHMLQKKNWTGG
jgi:ribosomal protein S18 acetylase RimI-like enzyme